MTRTTTEVRLQCGTLTVTVASTEIPLEELCGFGSRRSRRRGFVFVSKVLGKHWPVRPATFDDICARLAARLPRSAGPAVVIGLAETATGLGHGVCDAWRKLNERRDILYWHSTRYSLDRPPALCFEEAHSHATRHLLHEPCDSASRELLDQSRHLIIVDDEQTTGATAANLAAACRRRMPRLESVTIACLTDWMPPERRELLPALAGLPVTCVGLLRGEFTFVPSPTFDPGPPVSVVGNDQDKSFCLPGNCGRLGLTGPWQDPDVETVPAEFNLATNDRILVLGTGEFHYPALRWARALEQRGYETWYQSTTRSPLLRDGDLQLSLEFTDNYHEGIPNFLYNVDRANYDRVFVGYETDPLPADHRLLSMLSAEPILMTYPGLERPQSPPVR